MIKEEIIIVDDEAGMLNFLSKLLISQGYRVSAWDSAATFLEALKEKFCNPVLAIIDYRLPDSDGSQLLQQLSHLYPDLKIIIITAYGDVQLAVETMKLGAHDFLAKPFSGQEILQAVNKVLEPLRLKKENELLRLQLATSAGNPGLIGASENFAKAVALAERVAGSSATVLLTGESGTGKEVIAAHIHKHDPRRAQAPFLAINCGALTDNLLESQLFGTVRGAFTGAEKDTQGLFRAADQGTLLLDEIADTSAALQLKLLRVLEAREVIPVGGTRPYPIDVRIIAATNKNLQAEVAAGRFREDLFYRLQVFTIELPPLRHRVDDIIPLVEYFLAWYSAREGRQTLRIDPAIIPILKTYSWPGNVRELRNLVHRAVILAQENLFDASLLPFSPLPFATYNEPASASERPGQSPLLPSLSEVELEHIRKIYNLLEQDRKKTSEVLGISEKTLGRKLKQLDQLYPDKP
ncbi:MAG: sigma-54-dependent Fis family transcriptional regulator [Deltaproteobacteria bacterium]|nr:sigma-54-dependent Fis family transcriptional regulator [Deltaproteobacteria bacterium]